MTGYLKALCSILGTLLALALIASPGVAQKKKKKAAEDAPAAEAQAEGGGSLDSLMESAAEKKEDKKKGKKGEEEAAEEEEAPAEEAVAEPDEWERPPVEEKAPPKEAPAEAPEPSIEKPISVALLLGYGFKTDRQTAGLAADPYGFMAGVRGGYTLDFMLYVGVYFNYYLGSSKTGDSDRISGVTRETSVSYMQFGAEAGYDVPIGPVLFRPSVQLGMALAFSDATGQTRSSGDFMFAPGVTVVHPIDDFFIGGDLRGNIVTGDGVSGVTLAATAGMVF